MNAAALSLAYLRHQPLSTALSVTLLAVGVGTIALLLLFGDQLQRTLQRDARGIDMVVGAKGSPVQLIMSSVFHVDMPTGNIRLEDARALAEDPMIGAVLPLALGDSYRGFRIVGTEHGYPALFDAELAGGRLWQAPLEATVGALAAAEGGLEVGTQFVGAHGLALGGMAHEETPYRVVGAFAPTGSVLDRLVLASVESVWEVHGHHGEEDRDDDREITALLVQLRNPIGAAVLPRRINMNTPMQAALPGFEIARMMKAVGFGIDGFRAFAWVLVASAGFAIFTTLYNALSQRRYDIAVMRALGASRGAVLRQFMLEGCMLSVAGAALGLLLGHGAAEIAGTWLWREHQVYLDGLAWAAGEGWLLLGAVAVGLAAAAIPAVQAGRIDISAVLARG